VPRTAVRGGTVTVWLGPGGRPTAAPVPSSAAGLRGVATGVTVLLGIWLAAAAVLGLVRWLCTRRRAEAWAREWRTISGPIGQDR
jgi:hypothetical protein